MAIAKYNSDSVDDFTLVVKNMEDIISETFLDNNEKLLAESIITSLESDAVEGIKKGLTIKIPNIGNYRYNPIKKHLTSHYKDFKNAKKSMTKDDYKEYVGTTINNWKESERLKDLEKIKIKKLKTRFKKKYELISRKHGISYSNLWFRFLLEVKPVEFDKELEEHLQYLYGNKSS